MGLLETEALILRTYDLSEADRIGVFFTEARGVVRGVAKGAKRLKSRFGSGLEPFSIVRLEFAYKEEKELVSVRNIEIVRSFFDNASDPDFLNTFSYVSEMLQTFSPPNEANDRLYRMTKVCLESAAKGADLRAVTAYFELWMLKLSGYLPSWKICAECRRELEGREARLLGDQTVTCADCVGRLPSEILSLRTRALFELIQKVSPDRFDREAREERESLRALSLAFRRIISRIVSKEVKGPTEGIAVAS